MRTWCSSPNGEGRCSTPLAPGGNIPIGLHRLRSGAEGIQRRTRPRTLVGQLSAEGAPVRVDEQPQRRLVAAHEAGIPGYLDVLEGSARARVTCGRQAILWGPWAARRLRFSAST